jgi:hypothetical protein
MSDADCSHVLTLVLRLSNFFTLKMEAICSSETSVHTSLYCATSQKTTFFIVTAVKTSNLRRKNKNSNSPLKVDYLAFASGSVIVKEDSLP